MILKKWINKTKMYCPSLALQICRCLRTRTEHKPCALIHDKEMHKHNLKTETKLWCMSNHVCLSLQYYFSVSVKCSSVVAGVWTCSLLLTALSHSDHSTETQGRNLSRVKTVGEQFRFRAYLRFYSKCKFA